MLAQVKKWPLAALVLVALALGVVAGLVLPGPGKAAWSDGVVAAADVVGQLWLAALRMTILPLVFALVATTFLRSHGWAAGGRAARRTIAVIFLFYGLAILVGALVTPLLLGLSPVSEATATALRSMGGEVSAAPLSVRDMILGIVPTNIVEAMASASLVPVLVFALLFGAAVSRLPVGAPREAIGNALQGLADAMIVMIGWIVALAPIGVFALVLVTANAHGADLLIGLAHYLGIIIASILVLTLIVYAVARIAGGVPLGRFASAVLPTQAVAAGTQSSLACLPLIIRSADRLGLRGTTTAVAAPLAVTLMRVNSPLTHVVGSAYAAAVYGIPFGIGAMLLAGLLGTALEVGSVGIPSTATYVALRAPVFALFGIPLEMAAVFLIVETIPDIVKTVCNVTADTATIAIVDRGVGGEGGADA